MGYSEHTVHTGCGRRSKEMCNKKNGIVRCILKGSDGFPLMRSGLYMYLFLYLYVYLQAQQRRMVCKSNPRL